MGAARARKSGKATNRIDIMACKPGKKTVFYLMAGDPDAKTTALLIREIAAAGASLIEIGAPFSDPVADGPSIQRAAERALKRGMTLEKTLRTVREARKFTDVPLVLMTYYNIILNRGPERFVDCLLYTSPSPRDRTRSRMPSSA